MDLETIKKYDDSVWLYILKQKTVFDTDLIKAQKDWLIEQAEKVERYEKALEQIAFNDQLDVSETARFIVKQALNK